MAHLRVIEVVTSPLEGRAGLRVVLAATDLSPAEVGAFASRGIGINDREIWVDLDLAERMGAANPHEIAAAIMARRGIGTAFAIATAILDRVEEAPDNPYRGPKPQPQAPPPPVMPTPWPRSAMASRAAAIEIDPARDDAET